MEKIYNQFSNKVILKNLLNFCFLAFLIIGFSSSKIFAQCGPTTYSISISTASYLDETVCQIRNAAGTVVHSFGPNATSSSYVASGTSPNNGPFTFGLVRLARIMIIRQLGLLQLQVVAEQC